MPLPTLPVANDCETVPWLLPTSPPSTVGARRKARRAGDGAGGEGLQDIAGVDAGQAAAEAVAADVARAPVAQE